MYNMAIFTEEIAMGLIARGFRLEGYSSKAWYFNDSVSLRRAVEELVDSLQ